MLSVQKLAFDIEGKKILNGISFKVEPKQIIGVLGKSGSGKSTLLKCIAGLVEYQRGIIKLDGELLKKPSEKLIPGHEEIKIVRQDNPLFPNVSLEENITYPLRQYQKSYQKSRVNKLLRLTGIKHVAKQVPRNVSEGEQQRAVIATALALEPKVLLLDEPFSNLDPANKNRLKLEIREIVSEEGMACIFVTHDVADIFGNANRLAILKKGRIAQMGTPEEVYKKPKGRYEAIITGSINEIRGDRQVVFRPEEIRLHSDGIFEGVVSEVKFAGPRYEIILKIGESTVVFWNPSPLELGSILRFNINRILSF